MTVSEDLPRIEALLRLRHHEGVTSIEPEPAAEDVGALSGVAYQWASPPVRAAVYVFSDMDTAIAAEQELHDTIDHPTVRTVSGLNGGLLLWAMGMADDEAGGELLDQLAESFAGEE